RAVRERLRDFDHLLLRDAELPDLGLRIDLQIEALEKGPGILVELALVDDERDPCARLTADEDVLCRGEVRHEAQLLMDDADAELLRSSRSRDVDVGAVQTDPSGVPAVDAGKYFHEGRLARAVLSDERMDLAPTKLKAAAAKRLDAGEVLADPVHLDQQVADRRRHDPSHTDGQRPSPIRDGPRPLLARSFGLLVQQRRDVRRVDVRLVVPVEARVDVLRYRLLVQYLPGRLDRLESDADRILGDRAGLVAAADRVHLLLAGVVPDDHDLARLTRFLHAVEHADGRTLVRAEDALEVRVRLQDRFRDIRRFELVATAVLSRDDLDVRVLALDLVGEALDAVDASAARLVMRDDRDVAAHADERRHLVRRRRGRRDVVR